MNRIKELSVSSLDHLPSLQLLDLDHQLTPLVIRDQAFNKQTNLTRLVLGSNRKLQLEPRAFEGLSNLKHLSLQHCNLNETILSSNMLKPLTSLETLDLLGNNIKRLQPGMHFVNMTNLKDLDLKFNPLEQICEVDLVGFRGKNFRHVNLNSVRLGDMLRRDFDWEKCGNPFKNISFEFVDLSGNALALVDMKSFFKAIQGTKISKLQVSSHNGRGFSISNLPDPDSTTFEGLKESQVKYLDLSKSMIFVLKDGVFIQLQDVESIDLSYNKVNRIDTRAFDGLQTHLHSLNLSHNLLGEIHSSNFASLSDLRVLDLSHNHIGVLGFKSFSGLPQLQTLLLTDNAIAHLGIPASLPKVQILKLNRNRLKHINNIGNFASSIEYLDVSDNRLEDLAVGYMLLEEQRNLQYLNFNNNPVEFCRGSSKKTTNLLKELYLDRVSLESIWSKGRCLDFFDHLEHLQVLSLTNNRIQTLPVGIFKGLKSIQKLDLSSNALTHIRNDTIPADLQTLDLSDNFIAEPQSHIFSSLQSLDLSLNRFHCGPGLRDLVSWMRQTNVTLKGPVEKLRCEFPSALRGVPLVTVYGADDAQ
ncbi:unnamed protein product [Knipowitschia caucasica]